MLPKLLDRPAFGGELLALDEAYLRQEQVIFQQLDGGNLPDPVGGFEYVFDEGELTEDDRTPARRFAEFYANRQVPIASIGHDAGHVQENNYILSVPACGDMLQQAAHRSLDDINKRRLFAKATDDFGDGLYGLRIGWAREELLTETRSALGKLASLAEPDPGRAEDLYNLLDQQLGLAEIEEYTKPHLAALGHLAAGRPDVMFAMYDTRVAQAAEFIARGIIPPLDHGFSFSFHTPAARLPLGLLKSLKGHEVPIAYPNHQDIQLLPAYQWLFSGNILSESLSQIADHSSTTPPNWSTMSSKKQDYFALLFESLGHETRQLLSGGTLKQAGLTALRETLDEIGTMADEIKVDPFNSSKIEAPYMFDRFEQAIDHYTVNWPARPYTRRGKP